jgi:hypothetical protein
MASIAQITANRENAARSTGPVTETGKSVASRNHLTLGLYTQTDYVKPEDRDTYQTFTESMYAELAPATALEQSLAVEITGATWRLRLCASAEAELAGFSDATDKTRRSIERARASDHSALHRSVNQLRKLQTERLLWNETNDPAAIPKDLGLAAYKPLVDALHSRDRGKLTYLKALETYTEQQLASNCEPESAPFASNCKTAEQTPRSAPCPCKSGLKYKRCCGRNAAPVLSRAA